MEGSSPGPRCWTWCQRRPHLGTSRAQGAGKGVSWTLVGDGRRQRKGSQACNPRMGEVKQAWELGLAGTGQSLSWSGC